MKRRGGAACSAATREDVGTNERKTNVRTESACPQRSFINIKDKPVIDWTVPDQTIHLEKQQAILQKLSLQCLGGVVPFPPDCAWLLPSFVTRELRVLYGENVKKTEFS